MKKHLSKLVCCLLLSSISFAQHRYELSVDLQSNYLEFTDGTSLTNGMTFGEPDQEIALLDLGFPFQLFDKNVEALQLLRDGLVLREFDGQIVDSWRINLPTAVVDRAFDENSGPQMGGLSDIRYRVVGTTGSRIGQIQFKNCGTHYSVVNPNGNNVDSMNFQIWLYEADNTIEYHFGTCSTQERQDQTNARPRIDIVFNKDISSLYNRDYYGFGGDPDFPQMVINDDPNYTGHGQLQEDPSHGSVWRFGRLNTLSLNESEMSTDPKLYPNPSSERIFISASNDISEVKVFDNLGRLVLSASSNSIDIRQLRSGTYLVKWEDAMRNQFSESLIVQ